MIAEPINIIALAQQVFSNDPLDPNSIPFEINVVEETSSGDTISSQTNYRDVFEILLQFFHNGLKVRYGDINGKVDLSQLTEEDFMLIKQYFHSIGFDVDVDIQPIPIPKSFIIDGHTLGEYKFCLKVGNDLVYIVRFDFLKNI
jgi:hypothetical protein